jgi:hypothetical protein|tara:strand:- start:14218 stop:14448 length:231 start_codon:yes stop_codon:yes gene_type:complete
MRYLEQVIHASADANLTGFVYTKVYASAIASPVINGTTVPMIAGGQIDILINTISNTADVFVLGKKRTLAPSVING